jgi:hypothetical protein
MHDARTPDAVQKKEVVMKNRFKRAHFKFKKVILCRGYFGVFAGA